MVAFCVAWRISSWTESVRGKNSLPKQAGTHLQEHILRACVAQSFVSAPLLIQGVNGVVHDAVLHFLHGCWQQVRGAVGARRRHSAFVGPQHDAHDHNDQSEGCMTRHTNRTPCAWSTIHTQEPTPNHLKNQQAGSLALLLLQKHIY